MALDGKEFAKSYPYTGGQADLGLDVKDSAVVDGEAAASLERSFFSDILKVKGSAALAIELDGKAVINKLLGSSTNFIAKLIVSAVNGLKKDETPVL